MFNFEEANKLLLSQEGQEKSPSCDVILNSIDQAVEELKRGIDIQPLVAKAEGYEIANVEQATQALSMALQARKIATALIASKKEITKPQLDFQKAVNKLVMDYVVKLDEIENNLKDKIEVWIGTSTSDGFSSGIDTIQVPDGSLKMVHTWTFEIEDTEKIPFEYMCANIEEIEKAVKGGMRQIPGVKIFSKQELKLRVKN